MKVEISIWRIQVQSDVSRINNVKIKNKQLQGIEDQADVLFEIKESCKMKTYKKTW